MAFRLKILLACASCLFALAGNTETAADKTSEETKDAIGCIVGEGLELSSDKCFDASQFLGKLDLTSPDNPLFNLMGSSPETIIRPKAGDSFSAALLPKFADALSADRTSLAIEFNPSINLIPERFMVEEVRGQVVEGVDGSQNRVDRLALAKRLNPLSLTVAYSESEGSADIVSYGLGASYVVDSGSPFEAMSRYADCIDTAYDADGDTLIANYKVAEQNRLLREWQADHPNDALTPEKLIELHGEAEKSLNADERYQTLLEKRSTYGQTCRDEISVWNRDVYGAGIAVLRSEQQTAAATAAPGTPEDSKTGIGAWGSLSKKVGASGQLTAGARITEGIIRERKSQGTDIVEELDSWSTGLRYTHQFAGTSKSTPYGKRLNRSIRGFAEIAYTDEKFDTGSDQFYQAGIGLEIQLQKNLFFQFVVGDTFSSSIERNNYLSGRVKWSFSNGQAE